MSLRRDWTLAEEKRTDFCRVCGRPGRIELAHIVGRSRDQRARGAAIATVSPHSVVPLCGPATTTTTCHGRYDAHTLDLLPFLSLDEQVQAVRDAGGLALAMRRICGRNSDERFAA